MCHLILSMLVVGAVQTGPDELTIQVLTPNKEVVECIVIPKPKKLPQNMA